MLTFSRLLACFFIAGALAACLRPAEAPIRVGILHSMTGTLAISARPVVDATLLAIEEINAQGGLLGRRLEPVIADGTSDSGNFAAEAERLITEERVSVVFGCWTSSSRKAAGPVFEKHHHLLFYPVQYEGLEQSPNIVYTGATPNQQVMPAVSYALANFGPRVFLVGSDYVFPRTANEIIRDQVAALGGEVVGELYLSLGGKNVAPMIEAIVEAKPEVILNTINGDSNVAFFRALREAGFTPDRLPVISFSISETELPELGAEAMAGNYAAWNYFQSVDTPENNAFLEKFRARFGADRVVSDPLEVPRDLQDHDDQPELARERRLGEEVHGRLVDLLLQLVEAVVLRHGGTGQFVVPFHQRAERTRDREIAHQLPVNQIVEILELRQPLRIDELLWGNVGRNQPPSVGNGRHQPPSVGNGRHQPPSVAPSSKVQSVGSSAGSSAAISPPSSWLIGA
jgi:urea transport system substrate-binding protein